MRLDYNKNKNLVHLTLLNDEGKEMWSVSYVTCIDLVAQVSLNRQSTFLYLDVLTLKLRIIVIIILPTDRPKIILPTACTIKNKIGFA